MDNMYQYFKQGDKIYGDCNGFFGRNNYGDRIVIFVQPKYVLFEYKNGDIVVLNSPNNLDIDMVKKWKDVNNV